MSKTITTPGIFMNTQTVIETKLTNELHPQQLEVVNESHMHGGPAMESHFKITVVSQAFDQQMLVKRHREIYRILDDELSGDVHALALHTYSPSEWAQRSGGAPASPDCRGGSKLDSNNK
jgi:BolA protein